MIAELSNSAFILLVLGNVLYAVGIIFFILGEYKPIYHVIWHLFVLVAAALHWFDVYFFIVSVDLFPDSLAKARVTELVDSVSAAANITATLMNAASAQINEQLGNNL